MLGPKLFQACCSFSLGKPELVAVVQITELLVRLCNYTVCLYDGRCCLQCIDTVGWASGKHPACKNWVMRFRCGCLSGVRCKWFAYGPADATATRSPFASLKLEWCNPWPHVAIRHICISHLLSLWCHSHYDTDLVLIMTSFSLWGHSLLSWPHPPLRTNVCCRHLTAFNI